MKTFPRIIHARVRSKCELHLDDSQFGFRSAFSTRKALFVFNVLLQKWRDHRQDVFVCFVDYEKAFDRVQHTRLIELLRGIGVDDKNVRIIKNLYWRQKAEIKVGNSTTPEVDIQRGVRQGCILSPFLFNLYADRIFKDGISDLDLGIKVNGKQINNLKYADDTVILAENVEDLQLFLNRISQSSHEAGLSINIDKTKLETKMVFSRQSHDSASLHLDGKDIEHATLFKYLGCLITENRTPPGKLSAG